MKKILFLVTEDFAFCSHRIPMAKAAADLGLSVVVVANKGQDFKKIEAMGFRFIPLAINRGGKNPFSEIKTLIEIIKIYHKEQPDIVHHIALKPVLYGSIAALVNKIKAKVNMFTGLGTIFTGDDIKRRIVRKVLLPVLKVLLTLKNSVLIIQNDDDLAVFRNAGIADKTKTVKIEGSGVDDDFYKPVSELEGTPVFTLVARMLKEKGVYELVSAAKILKAENLDLVINLVGDPDPANPSSISEAQLQEWHNQGLVNWLGRQSDIRKIWQNSHVAVLPSWREGMPKSLLEAGACQKPVITTDVPGCRELVRDGIDGILVSAKNPESLAKAIKNLAENKALRLKMGLALRERIEQTFSQKIIAKKVSEVYKSLRS